MGRRGGNLLGCGCATVHMSTYRFYYNLWVPVRNGGWHLSQSHRTIVAEGDTAAAGRLERDLRRKWPDGPVVGITEAYILTDGGRWESIDPDCVPGKKCP